MSEFKSFIKKLLIMLPFVALTAILASHIVAVPTNSMNPSIKAGDVVIVQKTDILGVFGELNPEDVRVGDVVVYEKPLKTHGDIEESESKECIIHRVIAVRKSNGKKYLILKGDNNSISDSERVTNEQVIAKAVLWNGNPITVPKLGNFIFMIKSFLKFLGM